MASSIRLSHVTFGDATDTHKGNHSKLLYSQKFETLSVDSRMEIGTGGIATCTRLEALFLNKRDRRSDCFGLTRFCQK